MSGPGASDWAQTTRMNGTSGIRIRLERPADIAAIRAVNRAAFETSLEADLVDALRERAQPIISLVADAAGSIVGHILFSPVTLSGHAALKIMGLAPMAVRPARQRRGIGSALVRAGLERCRQLGCSAVVVLGHAEYYPRFDFVPASHFGIGCEYDVPDDVFMALELEPGTLRGKSGTIRYHAVFAGS
jgi:putative acetyltransferase